MQVEHNKTTDIRELKWDNLDDHLVAKDQNDTMELKIVNKFGSKEQEEMTTYLKDLSPQ